MNSKAVLNLKLGDCIQAKADKRIGKIASIQLFNSLPSEYIQGEELFLVEFPQSKVFFSASFLRKHFQLTIER